MGDASLSIFKENQLKVLVVHFVNTTW